jgi:hypothetical protein
MTKIQRQYKEWLVKKPIEKPVNCHKNQIIALWVCLGIVSVFAVIGWFLPAKDEDKAYVAFRNGDVLRVEQEICTGCSSKCFVMTVIGDQHVQKRDRLVGQILGIAPQQGGVIDPLDNPRRQDSIPWPPQKYEVLFNENDNFFNNGGSW